MGFDFVMLHRPPIFPEGHKPYFDIQRGTYQLSGEGMRWIYAVMKKLDLLDEGAEPPDLSSVWPPSGIDADLAESIAEELMFDDDETPPGSTPCEDEEEEDPSVTEDELELVKRAHAQLDELLAKSSPVHGKVPAFKFGTNDGWIVKPAECRIIVCAFSAPSGYETVEVPNDEIVAVETLREWADFNNVAALNGGYRVL